jgi:hypothetical protein
MSTLFLVTVTCFSIGCLLSSLVSDLIVIKFLQKILVTPKEVRTNEGIIVQDATDHGIKMLTVTKAIGTLGFRCSLLTVLLVSFFVSFEPLELMITPACVNIGISCFFVLMAMVHKPFFVGLLRSK